MNSLVGALGQGIQRNPDTGIQTPMNSLVGTLGQGIRARRREAIRDRAYRDDGVCVCGCDQWTQEVERFALSRRRRPVSSAREAATLFCSESVMEMSVDGSVSSQWPTQRRLEPPPCPGTSAANAAPRHRRASSNAPPPA